MVNNLTIVLYPISLSMYSLNTQLKEGIDIKENLVLISLDAYNNNHKIKRQVEQCHTTFKSTAKALKPY